MPAKARGGWGADGRMQKGWVRARREVQRQCPGQSTKDAGCSVRDGGRNGGGCGAAPAAAACMWVHPGTSRRCPLGVFCLVPPHRLGIGARLGSGRLGEQQGGDSIPPVWVLPRCLRRAGQGWPCQGSDLGAERCRWLRVEISCWPHSSRPPSCVSLGMEPWNKGPGSGPVPFFPRR